MFSITVKLIRITSTFCIYKAPWRQMLKETPFSLYEKKNLLTLFEGSLRTESKDFFHFFFTKKPFDSVRRLLHTSTPGTCHNTYNRYLSPVCVWEHINERRRSVFLVRHTYNRYLSPVCVCVLRVLYVFFTCSLRVLYVFFTCSLQASAPGTWKMSIVRAIRTIFFLFYYIIIVRAIRTIFFYFIIIFYCTCYTYNRYLLLNH